MGSVILKLEQLLGKSKTLKMELEQVGLLQRNWRE